MKSLIRLEEVGLFLFTFFLFTRLTYAWWLFPLLLLAPDLGMLGYLISPRVGAVSYNLLHHRGMAVILYLGGIALLLPPLQIAGLIMLGHSSLDRVFGYGLKYADAFQHTHLGWIGGKEGHSRS
jgi:hypothetical protein